MNDTVRQARDFLVSLKLTVALLVLSMVLIFAATLDQVHLGIAAVQEKWFHSVFVLWKPEHTDFTLPVFPGGYLLGVLLFANLIAAHVYRFKLTWKKAGIFLTHLGLVLLLLGEFFSGILQQESRMEFREGETKSYSESYDRNELAILDTTDPKFDTVVAVPEALLAEGQSVQHPALPFRVVTKAYHVNAAFGMRGPVRDDSVPPSPATAGIGPQVVVTPLAPTYKQGERNTPAAFVELVGPEGSLGTWLVTPQIPAPQTFDYAGRSWRITMRPARTYRPFALTLLKATHDVYPGTDIPKNFSSRLHLTTPDGSVDREVLIYMNNPLRYAGLTFYQQTMDSETNSSGLQVVRNPGWIMPYVACILMSVGLVLQFGIHLLGFIRRRTE